jgi:rhamnose utilization protein RhaD (predicted bifunctional aldolase and dehydrogenase)
VGSLAIMWNEHDVSQQDIDLADLKQQAQYFGSDSRYVQGAGGNLSVKDSGTIRIKASGTRLKDAHHRDIFLTLDLLELQKKVLLTENLADLVITAPCAQPLRPSIETAIHALLPQKFVTHLHSVGSISRAIDRSADHVKDLEGIAPTLFVEYAKPGIPLARKILATLETSQLDAAKALIVILGNHGIIVAANSAKEIIRLVDEVEAIWGANADLTVHRGHVVQNWFEIAPAGALNSQQADLLLGGVLTPDELVFLGKNPFFQGAKGAPTSDLGIEIRVDGSVHAHEKITGDALEIARSFVAIAKLTHSDCRPNYLPEEEVNNLLDWDAEKWRKAQEQ